MRKMTSNSHETYVLLLLFLCFLPCLRSGNNYEGDYQFIDPERTNVCLVDLLVTRIRFEPSIDQCRLRVERFSPLRNQRPPKHRSN